MLPWYWWRVNTCSQSLSIMRCYNGYFWVKIACLKYWHENKNSYKLCGLASNQSNHSSLWHSELYLWTVNQKPPSLLYVSSFRTFYHRGKINQDGRSGKVFFLTKCTKAGCAFSSWYNATKCIWQCLQRMAIGYWIWI